MNKPSILIIDDEKKMLLSLSKLMGTYFIVSTTKDGEKGLELLCKRKFSALLLDLIMPKMGGLELLTKMRERGDDTKVVIMTGQGSYDTLKKCSNLNIDGYIEKPFEAIEVIEKLKDVTGITKFNAFETLWGESYAEKTAAFSPALNKAIHYIDANSYTNISREDIAKHIQISPDHLTRIFRTECGVQLREYIAIVRICRAKNFLVNKPDMTIREISEAVGMKTSNYFSRFFKKYMKVSPNEYRRIC